MTSAARVEHATRFVHAERQSSMLAGARPSNAAVVVATTNFLGWVRLSGAFAQLESPYPINSSSVRGIGFTRVPTVEVYFA